ncbi:MAG: hypothetical protein ACJAX4_000067 [Clostridium sp.]|jgi:hypothetical protein
MIISDEIAIHNNVIIVVITILVVERGVMGLSTHL